MTARASRNDPARPLTEGRGRKRILIMTHEFAPFRGGIATYAARLAHAASALGHEVTVWAPAYGAERSGEEDTLPYRIVRHPGDTYRLRDLPGLLRRAARADRQGYDVIHAADWPHLMAMAVVNRWRPVRFGATVYGTEVLQFAGSRQARLLGVRNPFAAAQELVCVSSFTRRLLQQRYTAPDPARVRVVPLGVSEFWMRDRGVSDVARTRARHGIPVSAPVVLAVSRLERRKGHRLLLEAIAHFPDAVRTALVVIIVGRGRRDYVDELEKRAASCGARVLFLEDVVDRELRDLYAAADVFCLPGEVDPTHVEGFGLVYLEAAAQGLPSVACEIGAVPEVVRHEETGLLVPAGAAELLAQALVALLDNADFRRRLATNAQRWARTFSWENCARRTFDT